MRRITLMVAFALVGVGGLATAGPNGEETLSLDLTAIPGGGMYYLKCSASRAVTNCGIPSLWQQTNEIAGLQTGIFATNGRPYQPDAKLIA